MSALENASEELCLSLHQPWASLLVYGIKRIEGRDWSSKHRGRLWIHATTTKPNARTIQEMEDFYRRLHGMDGLVPEFPATYPTGALVGCVSVVDVLTAEQVEAWPQLPASVKLEVGSPHAFLCEDARILTAPMYMRGWPRIWHLSASDAAKAKLYLISPPQLGRSVFAWSAFERPADLLSQKLPVSSVRNRFKEKYGSTISTHLSSKRRTLPDLLGGEGTLQDSRKHTKTEGRILWNVNSAKRIIFKAKNT